VCAAYNETFLIDHEGDAETEALLVALAERGVVRLGGLAQGGGHGVEIGIDRHPTSVAGVEDSVRACLQTPSSPPYTACLLYTSACVRSGRHFCPPVGQRVPAQCLKAPAFS